MRELVIGEESESEEEMPPARVLGGGGGGGGLGDEAPELERQMGCMAGIFQIFDRRQRLLTARRRRPPPKMLPPGPGERRIFFSLHISSCGICSSSPVLFSQSPASLHSHTQDHVSCVSSIFTSCFSFLFPLYLGYCF